MSCLAHPPRLDRVRAGDRQVGRTEGRLAHVEVRAHEPAVDELDAGQRSVPLHLFHESFVCRDVGVVPDPPLDVGGDVRRVVDLDLLRAHDGPAAFRLHAAHDGVRGRMHVPHAVAVGNLEEPVASRHRPDLHGLEEDVESWFPHRLGPEPAAVSPTTAAMPARGAPSSDRRTGSRP